jgi:hypothetical protein
MKILENPSGSSEIFPHIEAPSMPVPYKGYEIFTPFCGFFPEKPGSVFVVFPGRFPVCGFIRSCGRGKRRSSQGRAFCGLESPLDRFLGGE